MAIDPILVKVEGKSVFLLYNDGSKDKLLIKGETENRHDCNIKLRRVSGYPQIKIYPRNGDVTSVKLYREGTWIVKLKNSHPLPTADEITAPIRRLLMLAGIHSGTGINDLYKRVHVNSTSFTSLKCRYNIGGEKWTMSDYRKCDLPQVLVVKGAILDEKELREFGEQLAKSTFGESADYEYLEALQSLENARAWIEARFTVKADENDLHCFSLEEKDLGKETTEAEFKSIFGSLFYGYEPVQTLLNFWGYKFFAEFSGSSSHIEYANILDQKDPVRAAEKIAELAEVITVSRGSSSLIKLKIGDGVLYPHQKTKWTHYPDGLDKYWWAVRELLQIEGTQEQLVLFSAREENHIPPHNRTMFLWSGDDGVLRRRDDLIDNWSSDLSQYRPQRPLGNASDWVCLYRNLHGTPTVSTNMIEMTGYLIAGETFEEDQIKTGIPIACLSYGSIGYAGFNFRTYRGDGLDSLMFAAKVPVGEKRSFYIVTARNRFDLKLRLIGLTINRPDSETVEYLPCKKDLNVTLNMVFACREQSLLEGQLEIIQK